jgi:hypothetical protein
MTDNLTVVTIKWKKWLNAGRKHVLLTGSLQKDTDPSLDTSLSRLEILSITSLIKNWQRGVPAGTETLLNKLSR